HAKHALAGINREDLALAQMQQARDRIDVRPGDDDSLNRRGTQSATGMEEGIGFDLLAKVLGRVEQEPALAVTAHGKRRLGSGQGPGVAGTRAPARLSVRIPLRESTAGRGPEDDGLHAVIER